MKTGEKAMTQQATLSKKARMREIALRDGMKVAFLGWTRLYNRRVFAVKSRTAANDYTYYPVIHTSNGCICECKHHEIFGCCAHIETVLLYLESIPVKERGKLLLKKSR